MEKRTESIKKRTLRLQPFLRLAQTSYVGNSIIWARVNIPPFFKDTLYGVNDSVNWDEIPHISCKLGRWLIITLILGVPQFTE